MTQEKNYSYQCLDADGRIHKGQLSAENQQEAFRILQQRKLRPLKLKTRRPWLEFKRAKDKPRPLKSKELTAFTRQAAVLIDAGVPVAESMQILAQQMSSRNAKRACLRIYELIAEGQTFTATIPQVIANIPTDYVGSLRAAEESGKLGASMLRLADYLETKQLNREKTLAALTYPAIVSLIALGIVVGLLVYVVPQVVRVFEDMDQELPLMTRVLLDISAFVRLQGGYSLLALLLFIALMQRLIAVRWIRHYWHTLLIHLPVMGKLIRDMNALHFSRALALLTTNGVPVFEALRISIDAVHLMPMRDDLEQASELLRRGTSIGTALQLHRWLSPIVQNLIVSGEKSGRLATMLHHACNYQQQNIDKKIRTMMALMEPILILTMGLMVLFIVLSILLPIFQFNQSIG